MPLSAGARHEIRLDVQPIAFMQASCQRRSVEAHLSGLAIISVAGRALPIVVEFASLRNIGAIVLNLAAHSET